MPPASPMLSLSIYASILSKITPTLSGAPASDFSELPNFIKAQVFACLSPRLFATRIRLSIRDISSEASCLHFRGGDDKRTYASQTEAGGHTRLPLFSCA